MASTRRLLTLGLLALVGACATPETPEQRQVRLAQNCAASGFKPDSDSYRLCLLIQQQSDRLAVVERRLSFIEQDTRFPPFRDPYWR